MLSIQSKIHALLQVADQYGARRAALFGYRLVVIRRLWKLANKLLPCRVRCPCCGWEGYRFQDYVEPGYKMSGVICPQCESHPRHRALYLWLVRENILPQRNGQALIFAPEPALRTVWNHAPNLRTVMIDLDATRDIDLVADVRALPFASGSLKLIWCHHVLEHVQSDLAAISELARVLSKEGGELIVSVPTQRGSSTVEFGFPDPLQTGHWRIYGDDFPERLSACGLHAEELNLHLTTEEREKYVIPDEPIFRCRRA